MKLSIVVPLYCCEGTIEHLVARCRASLAGFAAVGGGEYEFILVDDRSPQNDWAVIRTLAVADTRIRAVRLSRNFGQHAAITAGLERATGDCVVVMDGDLQDRPEEIPRLIEKYLEGAGHDGVVARRMQRRDRFFKRLSSRLFYWVLHLLTGLDVDPTVANFGIYSERVVRAVLSLKDKYRFFPLFVQWVGFDMARLDVIHSERTIGASSYTFAKALGVALNAFLSFSDRPLRMMVQFGLGVSLLSFTIAVLYFIGSVVKGYTVQGWPSLIISLWFLAGIQILFLGIVGAYVARNFEQTKDRPVYIVSEEVSHDRTS